MPSLLPVPDTIPSISLEDLNKEAALMTRVDRKYLVPLDVARAVVVENHDALRILEIDGSRQFAYSSRYFDTESLDSFRAAATARRHRFKVRVRTYDDSGLSFLEVKTRTGRGESTKTRLEIASASPTGAPSVSPENTDEILRGKARAFVEAALDSARFPSSPAPLVSTLNTSYDRTTVVHEEGSRLTIDSSLRWALPESGRGPHIRDLVIVETKSARSPGALDRALWRRGHRPCRISKYATGLALVNPDLSSNRWHRTLRALSNSIVYTPSKSTAACGTAR